MNIFVELIINLFDAIVAIAFVTAFCKISFSKLYYSIPACLLCFITSTVFLFFDGISAVHSLIITLILYAYCLLCRGKEKIRVIFAPLLFELTLIINNSFFLALFSLIFKTDVGTLMSSSGVERMLLLIGAKIMLLLLLFIIIKSCVLSKNISVSSLFLYLVSPLFTVYILYVFMDIAKEYYLENHMGKIIAAVICLAVINIFTIILFEISNRNAENKRRYDLLQRQMQLERDNYSGIMRASEKLHKIRHDIKNHLIYIKKITDNNETDKLNEYIDGISKDLQESDKYMVTGNRILDYILSSKISEHKDITFICAGDKFQLLDNLNELDVAILFGNIIDNAIEALENVHEKTVEIRVSLFNSFININVSNSVEMPVLNNNPHLFSTKEDKNEHGWGLKSVKSIVESYNGLFDCYEKNNKFTVHISIPIDEELSSTRVTSFIN